MTILVRSGLLFITGSPKYGETRKNIPRYYALNRLIRYSIVLGALGGGGCLNFLLLVPCIPSSRPFSSGSRLVVLGSLSNHDGNANENVTKETNFTFLKLLWYITSIPISSICLMWPNYPGAESVVIRRVFKFRQRKENSPSSVDVLHKTLNLVISRCCFAENGKEMYQNVKRMCRALSC